LNENVRCKLGHPAERGQCHVSRSSGYFNAAGFYVGWPLCRRECRLRMGARERAVLSGQGLNS
jgi:hypothetical protein